MKTMKNSIMCLVWVLATSCVDQTINEFEGDSDLETSQDLSFTNFTARDIYVSLKDKNGEPINGVLIKFYDKFPEEGGKEILKGLTDASGKFSRSINLGNHLETLVLMTRYIGLQDNVLVPVDELSRIEIKGMSSNHASLANVPYESNADEINVSKTSNLARSEALNYEALGTYNSEGVPDYLEPEADVVSAELLSFINASLPENQPVPVYHPRYLSESAETNLIIEETADVWMTFIHEGAGYRNVLGYYTYPTGQEPETVDDLQNVKIAFPNASFSGSGGGLSTGDKVNLGRFEPGTTIGFLLFANGWRSGAITEGSHQVFSNNNLNPESTPENRQHSVLLWDEINEIFLIGFEDLNRDGGSDNDFNDAIFYLSANPVEAVNRENINPIDKPEDTDGDGVNDTYDEFPEDDRLAYRYSYPGENSFGTFAFEDQWPGYGDYDFNDLVIDYQFNQLVNAQNKMVEMDARFIVQAVGAGFRNAFGFQMDLAPNAVSAVDGNDIRGDLFSFNSNGTEANQGKAVIIVSDNVHQGFNGNGFINTDPGMVYQAPDTLNVAISFSSSLTLDGAGYAPFNPFLVINQQRGREVHISSYAPTDLVDTSFFGHGNDNTDPDNFRYYQTKQGLPWAMNLPVSFDYPMEKTDIRDTYNHFNQWSTSGGFTYMDWYTDKQGFRYTPNVYSK